VFLFISRKGRPSTPADAGYGAGPGIGLLRSHSIGQAVSAVKFLLLFTSRWRCERSNFYIIYFALSLRSLRSLREALSL